MRFAVRDGALSLTDVRLRFPAAGTLASAELRDSDGLRRRRVLRRVDRELSRRNYKTALSLVKQLQGKPGGLRGFGAAKQVPQRISSVDELKLSDIDVSSLQPLVYSILDSIERSIQFASLDGVSLKGLESLMHDDSSESLYEQDHIRCAQHEAGHFLVAYLLGFLPKGYKMPSMETLRQDKFAGGRVEFVGFEFLDEGNRDKISSTTLKSYSCVILGGLVTEHLVFGHSKGLLADVIKLDGMLKSSSLTETEVDSQVKWAILNTVLILRRHHGARIRLADAMACGGSVGFCIDTIENAMNGEEI